MGPFTLLLAWMALFTSPVVAEGFEPKTMRAVFPEREVDRATVLGRGWLELGLGTDVKQAVGYWDSEGKPVDFKYAHWLYTTQTLAIRYGVTRQGELFWNLRTHYAQLTNDRLGTDTSAFGWGDPSFGGRYEFFRTPAPLTSLAVEAEYKGPAANEAPGNYAGDVRTFSDIIFTTGTPDLRLGLRGKRQVGSLAAELALSRVLRFSNVVQYLVEVEYNQFLGRIKPGDLTVLDGRLAWQVGPAVVHGAGRLVLRAPTRLGVTSPGLTGDGELVAVADSGGWSLDARPGLTLRATHSIDVHAAYTVPIRGEDLQFFPIEDIHPTRGGTFHGSVEFRY